MRKSGKSKWVESPGRTGALIAILIGCGGALGMLLVMCEIWLVRCGAFLRVLRTLCTGPMDTSVYLLFAALGLISTLTCLALLLIGLLKLTVAVLDGWLSMLRRASSTESTSERIRK